MRAFLLILAMSLCGLVLKLILSLATHSEGKVVEDTRVAGDYRVTITANGTGPYVISSIVVREGAARFILPESLFDDIQFPHIGGGFKPVEFEFEIKKSKAFIRIVAGGSSEPDDHTWILNLPLKDASRITRAGGSTGYGETRSATPLLKQGEP